MFCMVKSKRRFCISVPNLCKTFCMIGIMIYLEDLNWFRQGSPSGKENAEAHLSVLVVWGCCKWVPPLSLWQCIRRQLEEYALFKWKAKVHDHWELKEIPIVGIYVSEGMFLHKIIQHQSCKVEYMGSSELKASGPGFWLCCVPGMTSSIKNSSLLQKDKLECPIKNLLHVKGICPPFLH